jgi:hypothetical protein
MSLPDPAQALSPVETTESGDVTRLLQSVGAGDRAALDRVLSLLYDDLRRVARTMTPRTLTFHYPHTPAGTAELFRTAYGPTVRAFSALDEDRRAVFAADLTAHWSWDQRGEGSTEVDSEYLEVVAIKR